MSSKMQIKGVPPFLRPHPWCFVVLCSDSWSLLVLRYDPRCSGCDLLLRQCFVCDPLLQVRWSVFYQMPARLASCSYNILMTNKKSSVEECSKRQKFYIGKGNEARQALGEFISIKEELKFRDNFTCFAQFLDIISYLVMNDDIKKKIYWRQTQRKVS